MKKLIWVAGFVLAFAIPTLAQQPQPQAPSEYALKISPTDLDTIGKALGKLPFDEVAGLIQKLREQIVAQQPKAEAPKPVEVPAAPK